MDCVLLDSPGSVAPGAVNWLNELNGLAHGALEEEHDLVSLLGVTQWMPGFRIQSIQKWNENRWE